MRSLLFVPGDSERKLEKALGSGADVLIVDLEDSVALSNKDIARETTANFIKAHKNGRPGQVYVRINALDTGLTDEDLSAVIQTAPHGVMLPKSNSGRDVTHLSAKLNVHEAEAALPEGSTSVIPIITETAIGTLSASTYSDAVPRLAGITWGAEDLSAAVGARTNKDADGNYTDLFRFARTMTILAGSAAGVAPIDTVFVNFRDEAGLEAECQLAERDGFTAKMAIHPAQVPIINDAFTPSDELVAQARKVIEAFTEAGNPGVVAIDGQMFDRPHLLRAEGLIARAEAAGVG